MRSTIVAFIGLTLLLTGCAKNTKGKVSGKVVYKNQAVAGGQVNLLSKQKGTAAMARLDETGSFVVDDPIEAGTYTVYVTPPAGEPVKPGSKPTSPSKLVAIPKNARDPATSGVSVTINPGDNALTIELKD